MKLPSRATRITGGVVAYRDADRMGRAIDSLTSQRLPPGFSWGTIWLVVSPSTDATAEIAQERARRDPRIQVVLEAERRGKAAALAEVLSRADTDYIVLLNGDAWAEPEAVAMLLREVRDASQRFAVMARPVPDARRSSALDSMIDLLWEVHHDFHLATLGSGEGTHLSDEMMLVPGRDPPPLHAGIITDGPFIGDWVRSGGGCLAYASEARVHIAVPATLREHLVQRLRIHRGHRQVARLTGQHPSTLPRRALEDPRAAFSMLSRRAQRTAHGGRLMIALIATELLAAGLAGWSILTRRSEPTLWERIEGKPWERPSPGQREEPAV
ncbi:MAG: glycosyltransferase [Thermoplasmata archaeon]|nr:glycosyltransferase [Thermoplasmata archaeon]